MNRPLGQSEIAAVVRHIRSQPCLFAEFLFAYHRLGRPSKPRPDKHPGLPEASHFLQLAEDCFEFYPRHVALARAWQSHVGPVPTFRTTRQDV